MLKEIAKAVGKKIAGDNIILRDIAGGYYRDGKYLRAALLMLYAMPIRNTLKVHENVKRYDFITSPEYYDELQELLQVEKAEGFGLVRIGRDNDGGYIMLDDLGGGIAYSFGIASDVSWDKDMASRGYDVYMYDHTIDGLPENNPRFHWSKLGIADGMTQDDRLKSLEELIASNGHEGKRNMILKMDVEGAEWGFLEAVKPETLAQFGQIVFEFHGMNYPDLCVKIPEALRKINRTHQLVHLHGQNHGFYVCTGGKTFCNQIEVTYVLRGKYSFIEDYDVNLPIDIDMPAHSYIPEVELGHWNRKVEASGKDMSLITIMA
ncbi:MAG: FkbM family methyltransferase [Synergistaceae bacterium]|nr:FkbM family methyltransferase [Synergistaceae bacterium]